jgi:hypothetical protein
MVKINLLTEDKKYTFRSYFELPYEADDILAEFDYQLIKTHLTLPQSNLKLKRLPELKQQIEDILPYISLSSETARRETLVSPILLEVVRYCQCQLKIEYPLIVNNWLRGTLDYLLISTNTLLVIEAKNDDLTRGFTQLAVELIALSKIEEQNIFYGAVTIGNVWQFGKLDCLQKTIFQDLNLFTINNDLETLVRILVGILKNEASQSSI